MLGRVLIEAVGLVFLPALMYAVTSQYPVKHLSPSIAKDMNRIIVCLFPAAVYLFCRLYFAISFVLTAKLSEIFPSQSNVGKF
jgi:hypothetical protein